jgi:hypothetical protein
MPDELPILLFATPAELEAWLEESHAESRGVWLKIAKKGTEPAERHLCGGTGAGALLRLDRQPEARPRRAPLPAAVHAARRGRVLRRARQRQPLRDRLPPRRREEAGDARAAAAQVRRHARARREDPPLISGACASYEGVDHFDIYDPEHEGVVADQIDFLRRHLLA